LNNQENNAFDITTIDITMIGSSIFEFWQQPQWDTLKITNKAIRSTTTEHWLDTDFSKFEKTKNIILYCGSNDLIYGKAASDIITNIKALLEKLLQHFPDSQIGYFSIMKCPQKIAAGQLSIIDDINKQIKEHAIGRFGYFEFNDFISNDRFNFTEDGLHLTENSYAMLNQSLAPLMTRWVLERLK
jgi:lysophospholipase L1-like esterase